MPSKSLGNAVIRAFPGLFRILRMCAPRRAAAVVRPRGREKSADRRRRILISRLLIIRAAVPRRKSPFPAYFKGFPAISPLIPPYPAFLKYPVSPQKEMRVLSRAEQEKLCQYLYSNLDSCNIGILVCLFTGLRVGEICALRWEDVSFSDYTIHVHQTLQRIQDRTNSEYKTRIVVTTPKSACSIRTIPVPHGLMTILTAHKASSTGYILTNSDQNPLEPRTMQNHFKKVLKNSGITSANYHSLRHTFATRCIELGFDVKSLSEILGHASVNITMNRYVHPSMDLKRENMQRLSDLLAVK